MGSSTAASPVRQPGFCLYCLGGAVVGLGLLAWAQPTAPPTAADRFEAGAFGAPSPPPPSAGTMLLMVDFAVHGKVQRVFMRKHTKRAADKLNITGWCMNTAEGTVIGQAVGIPAKVATFKHWLQVRRRLVLLFLSMYFLLSFEILCARVLYVNVGE